MDEAARELGRQIVARVHTLCEHSEQPHAVTRRCFTTQHRAVLDQLGEWMAECGMSVRLDAAGNLVGRYEAGSAASRPAPILLLGSHLDTVRDAGRYDGLLGVVLPLSCVGHLHRHGLRLPFALEVVGFCDEEGVRFQSTLLGSRAMAGTLSTSVLEVVDEDGVSLAQAMREFGLDPARIGEAARSRENLLGYVEVHIEQGPVLEAEGLPVGVVTAIAGASRFSVRVTGMAGHAGTVPMSLRQDALCAAAEAVLAVERCCAQEPELVGTVGRMTVEPGAVNVIPGEVVFSLDLRAGDDALRARALRGIREAWHGIAQRRGVRIDLTPTHDNDSSRCDDALSEVLACAVRAQGLALRRLPSGAGHDAMAMAELCPAAMLFVRCEKGISHHPLEAMTAEDAGVAAEVVLRFLHALADTHAGGCGRGAADAAAG
jgi:allantoate deiminase